MKPTRSASKFDRFDERDVLDLLNERVDVAALTAAERLPFAGRDVLDRATAEDRLGLRGDRVAARVGGRVADLDQQPLLAAALLPVRVSA